MVKRDALKESVQKRLATKKENIRPYISTSCPIVDYYLANNLPGGLALGKVANIIGNSSAGKSNLALTILAEASINSAFDGYDLILDDTEFAMEFNIPKLFGKKLASRLRPPKELGRTKTPKASESIEELYQNLLQLIDKTKPFIYIVDSLDSIQSKEDEKRAEQFKKDGEADGTYGGGKPKLMSEMLRVITGKLAKTKSLLIIISQVRDKIGATYGKKEDRTGGRALTFYCTYVIWLNHLSKITHKISDKISYDVGDRTLVEITKNKLTGKKRRAEIHIYDEHGIDGITPAIELLIERNKIKKDIKKDEDTGKNVWSKKYVFKNQKLFKKDLVRFIESAPEYMQALKDIVMETCKQLEEEVSIDRRAKYE